MTHSLLRSLIRETLLTEEVYGAQAVVYHGTKAEPEKLISALLNDEFDPGRGVGSLYGKGLYTVYDLKGTQTERGKYGPHIIKLKLNLYGYIIFDPDVALKVYKAPLSIVEQAQKVGADEDVIEKLRSVEIDRSSFSSDAVKVASNFLRGRVKGVVYTGSRDGRCALVYDPTTAVPIAWKSVGDASWTPVDRSSIKPALRRSASGAWQEEKYETDPSRALKNLAKMPIGKRVIKGSLFFYGAGSDVTSLPAGLQVGGTLNLSFTSIASLPDGLRVGRDLILRDTPITSLPAGLQVGGRLDLTDTLIASLPDGLKVGGSLDLTGTPITSLPAGLQVGDSLILSYSHVASLPAGLHVSGNLALDGLYISSLPDGIRVEGDLSLANSSITSLPPDLQVGGEIYRFSGDRESIPPHLRSKI